MVNSSDPNGVIPTADDLEKGEVFEAGQEEHSEEEEIDEATREATLEKDLEKRENVYDIIQQPELLEPLLTPTETRHSELAAASKPLILTEKIVVSIVIVVIVLVEAYFVGRNLSRSQDFHKDGKPTHIIVVDPVFSSTQPRPQVSIENVAHVEEIVSTPESLEDFSGVVSEMEERQCLDLTCTNMCIEIYRGDDDLSDGKYRRQGFLSVYNTRTHSAALNGQ